MNDNKVGSRLKFENVINLHHVCANKIMRIMFLRWSTDT